MGAELAKIGVLRIIPVELSFVPPMSLTKLLEEADCVYVEMGNTFYLRYYMHMSGFDKVLPPLVRHSGLVYAGASSGAIVAGRSISTAFWKGWDDPQWSSLVEAKRGELGHGLLVIHDWEVHLAGSSVEQAPIHKGRSQSVFSSRSTMQTEVGPLTPIKEVKREGPGHDGWVFGDRQLHLVGNSAERVPINKIRSASVFASRPVDNAGVASLTSVARPFPTVSLPTFADSPSKFVLGVSKFVPTTVPLAYETLIGA